MGRAIDTQLGMRTSMRISVDNRAGRWGAIPGELLKTNPAGSTLAFLSSTTLADSLLAKDFPFDPQKDIAPLIVAALIASSGRIRIPVHAIATTRFMLPLGEEPGLKSEASAIAQPASISARAG